MGIRQVALRFGERGGPVLLEMTMMRVVGLGPYDWERIILGWKERKNPFEEH